jgi:hypothetical protein
VSTPTNIARPSWQTENALYGSTKAVHTDIHALLESGIMEQSDGRIIFPYDAVHVDFVLKAA